jgi:hypothetical protein
MKMDWKRDSFQSIFVSCAGPSGAIVMNPS